MCANPGQNRACELASTSRWPIGDRQAGPPSQANRGLTGWEAGRQALAKPELTAYEWNRSQPLKRGRHDTIRQEMNRIGLSPQRVQDRYDERYYASSPSVDPQGPRSGSGRVVRGGSWHQTTSWRSAFRRPYEPDYLGISIGCRLALSLDR